MNNQPKPASVAEIAVKYADECAARHAPSWQMFHSLFTRACEEWGILQAKISWDTLHELMLCGHPRACWQDRNYPASHENYDPDTKTSDPVTDYYCVACEQLCKITKEMGDTIGQLREHVRDLELETAEMDDQYE